MAKLVVISEIGSIGELSLVLDKVLETNNCPLKGMSMSMGIMSMKEMPESLRQMVENLDPSKKNKGKTG